MRLNIMYQDNVYQLSRIVDLLYDGTKLDLCNEIYYSKIIDDILFVDETLFKIFSFLQENTLVNGYLNILHGIFSCQKRYIVFLDTLINNEYFDQKSIEVTKKIQSIKNKQSNLSLQISTLINNCDNENTFQDVVSQNELNELLHF